MNGFEMMLKSMGLDVPKIAADFEQLKTGVTTTLQTISTELKAIREGQEKIWNQLQQMSGQQPTPLVPQPAAPTQPPAAQPQQAAKPALQLMKQQAQQ